MHDLIQLIMPVLIYSMVILSPGQNFLIVAYTSVNHSRQAGIWTASGVATGSGLYAFLALYGLHLFLIHISITQFWIKTFAATYLIYLGSMALLKTDRNTNEVIEIKNYHLVKLKAYTKGLLTNLANPKTIIFFISIFSLYVSRNANLLKARWVDVLLIVILSFIWYSLVAIFFSKKHARNVFLKYQNLISKLVGWIFIVIGISFLISVINL